MTRLKDVAAGAGYFSRYQYEAWKRLPEAEIATFRSPVAGLPPSHWEWT